MQITPISNFRPYTTINKPQIAFKAYYDGAPPYGNYGDGVRYDRVRIHNYTCFARNLGLFEDLPKMLKDKFPDGVKIYDYGCSVGYEPVSIALGLHNTFTPEEIEKYLPIYARDNHEKIIKKAKEFRLRLHEDEEKRLNSFKNINKSDYFTEHRKGHDGQKIYDCKEILKNDIIFEYADLFKDLDSGKLSDEPCVLLMRNAWQFMTPEGRKELADKLHENLKPGSIVIIGSHDVCSGTDKNLLEAGFERVNKRYSIDPEFEKFKGIVNENTRYLLDYAYDKSKDIQKLCFERK